MARIMLLILIGSSFLSLTFAQVGGYSVSCSNASDASGCSQCYRYTLTSTSSPRDSIVPRAGLATGQYEFAYLDQSTITAQSYQGASVTPTGTVTSLFNLVDKGTAGNPWAWATMKSGEAVVRGNIPTTINYNQPVYIMRFNSRLGVKDSSNAVVPNTDVSRVSCALFYAPQESGCGTRNNAGIYDQSSSGNALNSSSSGLCASGASIADFTYKSSQNKWTWACSANSGQTSCQATRTYCGNNSTEDNEQCDDGNSNDNDGCDTSCHRSTIARPDIRISVADGRQNVGVGSRPRFIVTVANTGNTELRNVVVVSPRAPLCDTTIGTLAAGESKTHTCEGPIVGNSYTNTIRVTGRSSTDSSVVSDEVDIQVVVSEQSVECGNGIREADEECDDGNGINNDSCSNSCMRRDGQADPRCRVEALDYSGAAPLRTTLICTGEPLDNTFMVIERNGREIGTYRTDEKNYTFNQSGNYTVTCYPDDSRENRYNSCETTVEVGGECGNGVVEEDEQCDDGNTVSGDSCSRYCRDSGSLCGNGYIDGHEQCDDGNNNNGDGCSNICDNRYHDSGPSSIIVIFMCLSILFAGAYFTYRRSQA